MIQGAYMDIAMSGHNFWEAAYEAEQLANICCFESCVYVFMCLCVCGSENHAQSLSNDLSGYLAGKNVNVSEFDGTSLSKEIFALKRFISQIYLLRTAVACFHSSI